MTSLAEQPGLIVEQQYEREDELKQMNNSSQINLNPIETWAFKPHHWYPLLRWFI